MSATIFTTQLGATVHDFDWLPEGDEPNDIRDKWADAVEAASEAFKAAHPEWFVC